MNFEYPEELLNFINLPSKPFQSQVGSDPTAMEILKNSNLPYLSILGFDPPVSEMYQEALRLEPVAVPHRSQKESHRGWKSLVLHGISSVHTQNADRYGYDVYDPKTYRWTDIANLCPITTNYFKNYFHYQSYHRVRFMFLEPGGYILPHNDVEDYYLGPVNIALNNPKNCHFFMNGYGEIPFSAGTINKLALVNKHAVINKSTEVRIHIIVHGSPDPEFWNPLYKKSYKEFIKKREINHS